jgi:hypothetical protein
MPRGNLVSAAILASLPQAGPCWAGPGHACDLLLNKMRVLRTTFLVLLLALSFLCMLMLTLRLEVKSSVVKSILLQEIQPKHKVCTYFQPLGLDPYKDNMTRETVGLWQKSWERQGWETRVLTEKDAESHTDYQNIKKRLMKLPTVNTLAYEMSCYLRWVAVIATGCQVPSISFSDLISSFENGTQAGWE